MINKTIATIALAGALGAGNVATTITQPINVNYADTGTKLVTYVQGNEIAVEKGSPRVTLQKWGGQEQLGISVGNGTTASAPVGLTTEVDNSIGNGQTVKMEPTADGQGFNVDISLASKPASNIFTYQFTGWENMDFLYQPPLWQEAGLSAPTADCTDTDCVINGDATHRPDNVVGSYAVYSKSHVNHLVGQTNYETGKLFHIYRPQATDANGSTIWASLSYSNGVLSVIVPQSFLDSAAYPVTIDPTFGYTTVGASAFGMHAASLAEANTNTPDTYLAVTGDTITQINLNANFATSGSATVGVVTYTFAAGQPVTRTGTEQTLTITGTTSAWYQTGTLSVSLTGGTKYTLAEGHTSDASNDIRTSFDSLTNGTSVASSATLPASWSQFSTNPHRISEYATYTAGGGGGATTHPPPLMIFDFNYDPYATVPIF